VTVTATTAVSATFKERFQERFATR
jgi:hypothetical protein